MSEQPTGAALRPTKTLGFQSFALALMRIAIGWHFLYEGVVKLLDPNWTSAGYLQAATGPAAEFFQQLAADPRMLAIVDELNIWGLILIGGCLILGLLARLAALGGVVLLALYYFSQPPLFAAAQPAVAEGHYLLVNKNLVELLALAVLVVFPAGTFGLDGLLFARRRRGKAAAGSGDAAGRTHAEAAAPPGRLSRREILASLTGVPVAGAFALAVLKRHGWESHEEKQLAAKLEGGKVTQVDALTAPTKTFDFATLDDLKGKVPTGKIGDVTLSRVILGGNLIGGWAHARDLIYVSKLVKAYHNQWKIFETFKLAEACGVNTILTNPLLCEVINEYWKSEGGKIQFISDCGGKDVLEMIQKSIDNGACACYIQGGVADKLVADGDFDTVAKGLELIRSNGLPAGIGAHKLATVQACVEQGFQPDFWMKTLHQTNYWSATPEPQHDNIWCEEPEETVAYMRDRKEPWIAFKTLAAGAIQPKVGFKYAFQSGADFICVGMYDFQIVEDVNLALDLLDGKLDRQRQWYA